MSIEERHYVDLEALRVFKTKMDKTIEDGDNSVKNYADDIFTNTRVVKPVYYALGAAVKEPCIQRVAEEHNQVIRTSKRRPVGLQQDVRVKRAHRGADRVHHLLCEIPEVTVWRVESVGP